MPQLPLYSVLPFVLMLLSIAVIPLINAKWWHHNYPKVSLLIGAPMAVVVAVINWQWLYKTSVDYVSFIILLGSLFIISGGILLRENLKISSINNGIVLVIGAVLANLIGTTGAAMLLIRPLIRMNAERKYKAHLIVFFIFIVANIGGSLTALGDPPLFLGFLQGVPFFWTFKLLPAWSLNNGLLLLIFLVIDFVLMKREGFRDKAKRNGAPVKIYGKRNLLFLAGVILAILIFPELPAVQVIIMITMAFLSFKLTPKKYRQENGFTWAPIKEVAILFAAIFATMIPALQILETRGAELGIQTPYQFFWATGVLSSFLDNAPTYLSFLSLAKSVCATLSHSSVLLFDGSHITEEILMAISMGAVFMGANTYIGNGPNFMVKSIAEEAKINMPSFFGYMVWSILILIPIFILDTFIFFM